MERNSAVEAFERAILGGASGGASPEHLKTLAKMASEAYLTGASTLNDAIIKLATDNSLNAEQTKRVCEEANVLTFQDMFRVAEGDRNVEFPVADASVVLPAMAKTACVPKYANGGDYRKPPTPKERTGPLMKTAEVLKEATPESEEELPSTHSVTQLWHKLRGTEDTLQNRLAEQHRMFKTAEQKMFKEFIKEWRDGTPILKIARAMRSSVDNVDFANSAVKSCLEYMNETGVINTKVLEHEPVVFLEKQAEAVPDPNHPLVQTIRFLRVTGDELLKTAGAVSYIQEQREKLDGEIKKLGVAAIRCKRKKAEEEQRMFEEALPEEEKVAAGFPEAAGKGVEQSLKFVGRNKKILAAAAVPTVLLGPFAKKELGDKWRERKIRGAQQTLRGYGY